MTLYVSYLMIMLSLASRKVKSKEAFRTTGIGSVDPSMDGPTDPSIMTSF